MAAKKLKKKGALMEYFEDSYSEIRKVQWPTKNTAVRLTFLVLGFVFAVALMIGILDFVFGFGYRALLDQAPDRALPVLDQPGQVNPIEVVPGEASSDVPGIEIGDIEIDSGAEAETTAPAAEVPAVEDSSS